MSGDKGASIAVDTVDEILVTLARALRLELAETEAIVAFHRWLLDRVTAAAGPE